MKIFLDTSTLVKLYHREVETASIEQVFLTHRITHIFLCELSKLEFDSAIWKKVRTREITEAEALSTLELFESDFNKYSFITTDSLIIEQARALISKYGVRGLRTLDSIQLSCSVSLKAQVDCFFSSDQLLKIFFDEEGLPTDLKEL